MSASNQQLIPWRVEGPTTLHGFDDDLVYIEISADTDNPDLKRQIALVSAWDAVGERLAPIIAALPKMLNACRAIVAKWEWGDLAEAARLCADAVNVAIGQSTVPESRAEQLLRLVAKAKAAGMDAEDLDEAVHDMATSIASNINNEGLDGQLAYLLENMGYEGTSVRLDELAVVIRASSGSRRRSGIFLPGQTPSTVGRTRHRKSCCGPS